MSIRRTRFQFVLAMAAGALLALVSPVQAAEPTPKALEDTAKAMAEQFKAMGLGMTPEKQKAMDAAMAKHMAGATPQMEEMGKAMAKSIDTPEMRASMDKIAKEMSGTMAKQLPVMMQALQPMMADMLPRMLRMQADMMQILFSGAVPAAKTE
jgi:hypothetical protein